MSNTETLSYVDEESIRFLEESWGLPVGVIKAISDIDPYFSDDGRSRVEFIMGNNRSIAVDLLSDIDREKYRGKFGGLKIKDDTEAVWGEVPIGSLGHFLRLISDLDSRVDQLSGQANTPYASVRAKYTGSLDVLLFLYRKKPDDFNGFELSYDDITPFGFFIPTAELPSISSGEVTTQHFTIEEKPKSQKIYLIGDRAKAELLMNSTRNYVLRNLQNIYFSYTPDEGATWRECTNVTVLPCLSSYDWQISNSFLPKSK